MSDSINLAHLALLFVLLFAAVGCKNSNHGGGNGEADGEADRWGDLELYDKGAKLGASVTGTILVDGRPVEMDEAFSDQLVVLVPQSYDGRLYSGLYERDGKFEIPAVKPGGYWLVLKDAALVADVDVRWAQQVNKQVWIDKSDVGAPIDLGTIDFKTSDLRPLDRRRRAP